MPGMRMTGNIQSSQTGSSESDLKGLEVEGVPHGAGGGGRQGEHGEGRSEVGRGRPSTPMDGSGGGGCHGAAAVHVNQQQGLILQL